MAYEEPLPENHHVLRGCSRGHDNGEVTASAFAMRKGKEQELRRISVDWIECPYADEIDRNSQGAAKRMATVPIMPPYAILNVDSVRQISRNQWALDVKEFGGTNPCHCGITGFSGTQIDLELQIALAEIANQSQLIDGP